MKDPVVGASKLFRKLFVPVCLIGTFLLLLVGCASGGGEDSRVPVTPGPSVLCERVQRDFVDFSVLNDVHLAVKRYSVFRETADDPERLLRGSLVTVFGFLGVPPKEIPDWANEAVEKQLSTGTVDFAVLNDIYTRLRADPRYADLNDPEQSEELLISAINGVIRTLGDPFASYFTAEDYKLGATHQSDGAYQGIGIRIERKDGFIQITSVFPGSPAERAGLKYGDKVIAVDGKSAEGCSPTQFVSYTKQRSGKTFTFTVERLDKTLHDIRITSGNILLVEVLSCPGVELSDNRGMSDVKLPYDCPLQDASKEEVEDVLYIKVDGFSEQALADFTHVLESVDFSNFSGIVIDLRGNPGGSLAVTTAMLDFFLEDEVMFRAKRFENNRWVVESYRQDKFSGRITDLPIAVLVDRHSASASELFSAAMKDNGRAVVIGERTTGKGTANNYFELRKGEYGALYLAVFFFLSPNGDQIEFEDANGNLHRDPMEPGGVTPSVEIILTDDDVRRQGRDPSYDPVLFKAFEYVK